MPSKYKMISSQRVIAKLYRDLRLSDSRYVVDMIEWFGEAMEHIRVYPALQKKVVMLSVTMHRVKLPDDVATLEPLVRTYDGGKSMVPMSYNASVIPKSLFNQGSHVHAMQNSDNRYIINAGYVETNFEQGDIVVPYLAFPRDDDGFPMIPEEVSFNEALKWYAALRMTEGGWKHPAGLSYEFIEQRWGHYCAQARQKAKMPDMAEYQQFLEMWVRLVPDYSAYRFGFDDYQPMREDVVDARGIVIRGVDQVSHFGPVGDEDSPSPA